MLFAFTGLSASAGRMGAGLLAAGIALSLTAVPALSASATEQQAVQLSLKPVGQPGSYFDLTVPAGKSTHLQVELGNHGDAGIAVRTYAADAYSIVNGGFGVKDRDSAPTGTTTWLDYPAETLQLPAGQAVLRDIAVAVPTGTAPGQYLAAIALENDVPVQGSGSLALSQLVRQAIAVSIRVPGPLQPAFTFTAASHKIVAGRSVVSVGIRNSGNANLKPAGRLVVHDSSGKTVSEAPVTMGSLYAGDTTSVEVTLAGLLQEGSYTAALSLSDAATHTSHSAEKLPFTVRARSGAASSGQQQGALPQILRDPAGTNPLLIIGSAGALLIVVTALVVFLLRRRRKKDATG